MKKENEEVKEPKSNDLENEGQELEVMRPSAEIQRIDELQSEKALESYEFVAKNIERFVSAQLAIRRGIMNIALKGDWVVFGAKGDPEADTANLSYGGCTRIASTLKVTISNRTEMKRIVHEDDKGRWVMYCQYADFEWNGIILKQVMGAVSSRDKFFGKAYGEMKKISDVSEQDVMRACHRAVVKEGVKLLFGLHQVPIADLSAANIVLEYAKGHKFDNTGKGNDSTSTGTISEAQGKRLFAIRNKHEAETGITDDILKKYLQDTYKISSSKAIKKENYDDIVKWVQGISDVTDAKGDK